MHTALSPAIFSFRKPFCFFLPKKPSKTWSPQWVRISILNLNTNKHLLVPFVNILEHFGLWLEFCCDAVLRDASILIFWAGFSSQKRSDQSTDSDVFVICDFKGSFLKLSMHGEHLNYISFPRALSTRWLRWFKISYLCWWFFFLKIRFCLSWMKI